MYLTTLPLILDCIRAETYFFMSVGSGGWDWSGIDNNEQLSLAEALTWPGPLSAYMLQRITPKLGKIYDSFYVYLRYVF